MKEALKGGQVDNGGNNVLANNNNEDNRRSNVVANNNNEDNKKNNSKRKREPCETLTKAAVKRTRKISNL